jgi:hypothetical protein
MTRPRFTHKDYVLIADTIARLDDVTSDGLRETIAARFANVLRGTNPAFDYARFIAAAIGKPTTRRDVQR